MLRHATKAMSLAIVALTIIGAYMLGLAQYPDSAHAPFYGIVVGLASALLWGATALEYQRWSLAGLSGTAGLLNGLAAAFAAMAVGYLAPKEACVPTGAQLSRAQTIICHFYPRPGG